MEVVTPNLCPHGLDPATCEICRVLDAKPVAAARAGPPGRRRGRLPSVATWVVVAIVAFVVVGWVAAAVFALLRIVELVVIAGGAGWLGFKLGVQRGRRGR